MAAAGRPTRNEIDQAMQVRHVHDVGRILLDVEAEFGSLRDNLRRSLAQAQGDGQHASDELDEIIRKAEHELRQKADLLLSSTLDSKLAHVPALPKQTGSSVSGSGFRQGRVRKSPRAQSADASPSPGQTNINKSQRSTKPDQVSQLLSDFRKQQQQQQQLAPPGDSLAAGQGQRGRQRGGKGSVEVHQKAIGSSLVRRKKIIEENTKAKQADGVPGKFQGAIQNDSAQLHPWSQQHMEARAKVSMACETERLHANVKLDLSSSSMQTTTTSKGKSSGRNRRDPRVAAAVNLGEEALKDSVTAAGSSSSPRAIKAAETTPKEESLGDSVLRIYEYETKMRAQGLYVFMVHKGVTLTRSSGFIAFKRAFEAEWGAISRLITKVETVMVKYDVEVAYMDGGKVAELARDQLSRHSESDILRCVCNEDQVRSTVQLPGRAFTTGSEDSEDLAAAAIQARFRGGRQRQDYHALRQEHRAARVITDAVRVSALQARLARQLVRKRAEENAAFQALQRKFKDEWKSTSAGKRVSVHVPSLSFGEHLRLPIDRFGILQNMQLSRLCDLAHRDVEVVYVAPMALVHEVRTYYEKLLQLRGIVNAAGRLHIVVPENAHRFPEHASLATTLCYSPKALERIRGLVCGKAAFVMPSQAGEEDRMLALALRVPLFAPEPDIVALYSTKSGAKEIFAEAEVNVPIGAYDIFEEDELYRMLAKLVAANLDVDRWVLKIDDEFAGRGIAVLDMSKFRFVQMARVDRARQTAKSHLGKAYWSRSDVQERARQKLEEGFRKEVRHRIDLQCPSVYPTWADFIVAFTKVGGVVEALPDSLLSSVSVCLAIDPDGFTRLLCTQDKISSRQWPFRTVGFVFPQTAVPHVALRSAAYAVAKVLFARGVIGHVSVDFAALMDPNVQSLRLWALGLDLRMTQALSTFRFFDFLLGGHIEDNSGEYKISVISESGALPSSSLESGGLGSNQESQGTPREGSTRCVQKELQTRAFAAVLPLHHPNLSSMTYSHFFNACRRHGISYDLRCAKGTAFELADSLSAGVVGAVSIERDAAQAAIQLQRSFNFMHKFLGAYVQQPAEDQTFDGTCTFSDALAVSKRLTAEIEEQYRQELADQRNIERAQQRLHAHQKQQRRRMRRNEKEGSEHEASERSETGVEDASKV